MKQGLLLKIMNMIFEKDYDPEILEEAIAFYNTHKQPIELNVQLLDGKELHN